MNLKPVKQHEDTEQMTNEKCKANETCEEITNEEHASHDKTIKIRPAKCYGHNEPKSNLENNVCEAEKKLEEHILPGKPEISKVQYEQVINDAPTKLQIPSDPEISQVPREEMCDRHTQDGSKMQENRDANKKADELLTSEYVLDKTIGNKISKNQKTCQVVDETAPTEANTEPETLEDQDSANEVLNTERAIKILDKTTLSTTNEAQESTQVQHAKVQNRQIKSKVCDKQETNKLYEEQTTLNREDEEEETRQVSGEQTTTESHSKQGTDQEEKQNDDREDPGADNFDNSNRICGSVDVASETISTAAIPNQTTKNSRNKRKSSTNSDTRCNEDEERCDSDESSSYGGHSYKPSESSDDEDDDKRDGEGTSTDNNAYTTSKRQSYAFICELCNQILYSDYARRKHRIRQHPNMQGRPIFKKIKKFAPKGKASKSNNESKSDTDRVTNVGKVNSTRGGKVIKRCNANKCNNSENASDSDWSTVSNSDCVDESSTRERKAHKNKKCTENTETVSENEIIKAASDYLVRMRKKRTTKLFDAERQGSRAVAIKENAESEEYDSDWNYSIITSSSTDESADSSLNTSFVVETDDEMEEDYDSQKTDVGESNDDSNLTTDEEDLSVSNNKTLNTSMRTSKKRKQRLLKYVNHSADTDETDGDQQVASEGSDNELLTDNDNQCDNNEIVSRNFGEERFSDDEIIKVSENTRKKRKERMSTLFDDDIEILAQNNDGNEQEPNNETNNLTNHIIPVVDKSGSEEVKINKSYEERPDLRIGENDDENFINVRDDQAQSKKLYCNTNDRDCDMEPAIESINTTVVSTQNNTSESSHVKLRDDDRHEIDLIDCLLKEYTTADQRNDSCANKEKDGEDDKEPEMHNDQIGDNIDNQPLLPPEINNCLENIQITNEDSEILSSLDNAVQQMSIDTDSNVNREVTKDELLSQNTNDNIDTIEENLNTKSIADNSAQIMSTADDVNLKKDFNKRDSETNLDISKGHLINKSTVDNTTQIGSNVEDLNIKQDMLKNEVSSQNTIEEDIQEYTKAFEEHLETAGSEQLLAIDEDLNIKKEMLKDESFSQNTNKVKDNQNSLHIEEIENIKENPTQTMSSNEDLNVPSQSLRPQVNNEEENLKNDNVVKDNLAIEREISKVVEPEDDIVIEVIEVSDDDDDVEFVGEDVNDQRFIRRRP
ncbi:uncharacterized protein DDB_G0283697-like [Cydia amplana]|uniref:uncharacterized protein DDB_G0283697-like n=1 Tax=Cydia amplana TaxID=1869771 RepID=UPI002FE62923